MPLLRESGGNSAGFRANSTDLRGGRRAGIVFDLLIVAVLSVLAWRSINYVSGIGYGTDSGVFASSASQILSGKVLYRDIFDHKPPMVHFIDVLAFRLGDRTIGSIRFAERCFAVAGSLLFYFVAWFGLKSRPVAFAATVAFLFHFYNPSTFQGGNLTEEYGSVFALGGILPVLLARDAGWESTRFARLCMISGLSFSLGVFTKETFVLTASPWFLYLLIVPGGGGRRTVRAALCFFAGGMVPLMLLLAYLVPAGAFTDWVDVFSFNFRTSVMGGGQRPFFEAMRANWEPAQESLIGVTHSGRAAFLLGIIGLVSRSAGREYRHVSWALGGMFACDYAGTALSGRGYGHYYMQLAGSFLLLGGWAVACLLRQPGAIRQRPMVKTCVAAVVFALVLAADHPSWRSFASRIATPGSNSGTPAIAEELIRRTDADDPIWSPNVMTGIYADTGRHSPTKYQYAFPHLFVDTWKSSRSQKLDLLRNDLLSRPPKVMMLTSASESLLEDCGLSAWVSANYRMRPRLWNGIELTIAERAGP